MTGEQGMLRRAVDVLLLICFAAIIPGCARRPGADPPIPLNSTALPAPESAVLLPGGDYHLVTVRQRDRNGIPVLCSEPSPDWAVAFGTALGGAINVGITGSGSGSLSGNSIQLLPRDSL